MKLDNLKNYLLEQVNDQCFPGGIAALAHCGVIKFKVPFGNACVKPQIIAADENTLYDVASLTKPLLTSLIILYLTQQRLLSLETRLGTFYERCPSDKTEITINNLLCHCSGITGWYPLYTCASNISGYARKILELPLINSREKEVIYSCPNYILLADIIQRVTSLPFAKVVKEMVFAPLGLKNSFTGKVDTSIYQVAATEENSRTERKMLQELSLSYPLRAGVIHGEVHDCNAFAAGGIAGNAGLFCNIEDAVLLADQFTPRSQLLSYETRRILAANQTPFGPQHRVAGWQLASSPESSAGPALSANAIGHTGFTGTSLWWDTEADLTYLLFTNRIHPTVKVTDIGHVRRQTHTCLKNIWSKLS